MIMEATLLHTGAHMKITAFLHLVVTSNPVFTLHPTASSVTLLPWVYQRSP